MNIRELITKWGFAVDHEPLEKVEHQLEAIKHRLEFLAAVEVVEKIAELTERFAKFAEELHVAAESAGLTVEAYQKLAFAAETMTVTNDQLSTAMARLSRHLYDARNGAEESQKVFQRAGFTQEQIATFHTGSDVLNALSDKFKNIQDPIKKQAIAMELLGRGSHNMVAFLSQGSAAIHHQGEEAKELGIILTDHQVEALTEVEHAMHKVGAVVKAVGAIFASYFAPEVESATHEFLEFFKANKDLMQIQMKAWVEDVSYALGFLWGLIKFITQSILDFAKAHPVLVRRITEVIVAFGALLSTLFLLQTIFGWFMGALGVLGSSLGLLGTGVSFITGLFGAFKGVLVEVALQVATLITTAFPALGEAILTFGAFLEATPIGWFLTAIVGLGLAIEALWSHFVNGKDWKDTWIGKIAGKIGDLAGGVKSFFGFGSEEGAPNLANGAKNMENIQDFASATGAAGMMGGPAMPVTQGNYEMNAPITITVPEGTDHKMVGEKVKEGVREHMDRVFRETTRSTRSAIAH